MLIAGCSSTPAPIYSRLPPEAPAPSIAPPAAPTTMPASPTLAPAPAPIPLPTPALAPVTTINLLPTFVPAVATNPEPSFVTETNLQPLNLEMSAIDPHNAKSFTAASFIAAEVQTSGVEPQSVLPPPPGPTSVTVSCNYPYPTPAYFEVGMWTNISYPPIVLMRTNTTSVTLPILYDYPFHGFSIRAVGSNLLSSAWATR